MGQELDSSPSPSPATSGASEEEVWAQLVVAAVWFATMVGAIFFLASVSARVDLAIGLGLFLVELPIVIAVSAIGWRGPKRPAPGLAIAFGWIGWNVLSGTCLAMYVLESYPLSPLQYILLFALGLAPIVVTVALVALAERVRRRLVSRHVGHR